MRLPDGRNVATRQAVRCKLLIHWAFEYFDQTPMEKHGPFVAPSTSAGSVPLPVEIRMA